jgi:hypothetical protein
MSNNVVDLEYIEITVDQTEISPKTSATGNTRSGWGSEVKTSEESQKQPVSKLKVAELEQRMSGFLGMVSRIFRTAEQETQKTAGLSLNEIELSVEIGAEGEIRLIGSGAKASGKGAIKLKFTRT